jgi:hypothetical protein
MLSNEILLAISLTLIAAILIRLGFALLLSGGDFQRVGLARKMELRILKDRAFAAQAAALLEPPAPKVVTPPKPSAQPLWLLALLQREGRLLDFLLEDIQGYPNEQIGAAVRDIHLKCRKAIQEHLVLDQVLHQPENATVEIPSGFDPSAIRLTGNVTGQPPFRGTLLHHGWRVKEIKLAPPPEGQDQFIVQPAEVELP